MSKKLSNAQRRMLEDLRDHGNLYFSIRGRSAMGGAVWTVQSLRKLDYINQDWHMTPAGAAALSNGQ
jgi:hypothetical protein